MKTPLRASWLERAATGGLIAVLVTIGAFAVWSSVATSRLGAQAIASNLLSDRYASAARAVANEESLERKYRLEPGPEVRRLYEEAAARLVGALQEVASEGDGQDRILGDRVLQAHGPYLISIRKMFDAVDRGQAADVLRIDAEEVDPKFDAIEQLVGDATRDHHTRALDALQALRVREESNLRTVPGVFAVGLALAALLLTVLRRMRRELSRQQDSAAHDAMHDMLTGLPNRELLADRFEQALRACKRSGKKAGLLLVDLDRFREVNDTLGHRSGDALLVQIGARLSSVMREVDTIARLGGDEFAVLLCEIDGEAAAMNSARRLRAS